MASTAALQVQVHEAGGLQRQQAGTAFADLLSAMEALPGGISTSSPFRIHSHCASTVESLIWGTVESVFFVQNFVWKNYLLLLVELTSNFSRSLFWRKFTSRVIYFCQIFSASKIFVKLLFIWAGLDVFPFKMMKKEACHRVEHVKISRNWSSSFVGRLCACLKNQMFERQWKMCSTGLNACNLGYGGQRTWIRHRCHGKHGEHRKNCTSGTVIESKEASRASPGWTRDWKNDFSRTPVSPKSPPKWGKGNFSSIATKNANSVSLRK